jgi:hypothetical protein
VLQWYLHALVDYSVNVKKYQHTPWRGERPYPPKGGARCFLFCLNQKQTLEEYKSWRAPHHNTPYFGQEEVEELHHTL